MEDNIDVAVNLQLTHSLLSFTPQHTIKNDFSFNICDFSIHTIF